MHLFSVVKVTAIDWLRGSAGTWVNALLPLVATLIFGLPFCLPG